MTDGDNAEMAEQDRAAKRLPDFDQWCQMQEYESRQTLLAQWVREFRQCQEDEEMATRHQTEAEVSFVAQSMEQGLIPDYLDAGGPGYSTYFVKVFAEYLESILEDDLTQEELAERLDTLRNKEMPGIYKRSSDGSAGQWRACNNYRIVACEWLLGVHSQQEGIIKTQDVDGEEVQG